MVIESQLTEIETVCESEDRFCPKDKKTIRFNLMDVVYLSLYTPTLPLLLHNNIYNM